MLRRVRCGGGMEKEDRLGDRKAFAGIVRWCDGKWRMIQQLKAGVEGKKYELVVFPQCDNSVNSYLFC